MDFSDLQLWTFAMVGATFTLYIVIAIRSRATSTSEFYVAGKHVHPVANGMATAADWMSAASFISMAGLIAFLGYDGAVYLMMPTARDNCAMRVIELSTVLAETCIRSASSSIMTTI